MSYQFTTTLPLHNGEIAVSYVAGDLSVRVTVDGKTTEQRVQSVSLQRFARELNALVGDAVSDFNLIGGILR